MTNIGDRLASALTGRYNVERELGHGGMATVHLAHDVRHGRTVAIKVLRPEIAQAVGSERFLREINFAAQLQSPHILPLLDSGAADGLVYYVMPFVEGDSLRDRLARQGKLPPSEAMHLLHDIVEGLAHAHRHHVVHRDIKPDNVMIAERHALLMDFGVARATSSATDTSALTSMGISLGTPAYMAPEQAAADPGIDHRADIYSIGVLAYEMLSGRTPFTGTPQAVLSAQIASTPAPLSEVAPEVPPAIAAMVMKCLEKEPGKRYQTADDLLQAIESLVTPTMAVQGVVKPKSRARTMALAGITLAALAGMAFVATRKTRDSRWVLGTGLPELKRYIEAAEFDSAFTIAMRIQAIAPGDSTLEALWPQFSRKVVLETEPAGVRVYRASLPDTSNWSLIGTTPTDSVRVPNRTGMFRFEKEGFRTVYSLFGPQPPRLTLDSTNAPHAEMMRVPGGLTRAFLVGSDAATPVSLGAYRVDKYEVTNADYKKFVDAGGYADRAYWEPPFNDAGRLLSFEAATARFVDRTGRPGPSSWEGGTFPAGQGEMPVGGVSWYEAMAYAKYTGKSLPTVYHWARVAQIIYARFVVPLGIFEASGPKPVGTPRGVSFAGVSDLAGNVREWCINESGDRLRFILGGGWSDPGYMFVDAYGQPPMDRSAINGIRLALYEPGDTSIVAASRPIPRAFTDYRKVPPVSDAVFARFTPQFDYDPVPLDAKVEVSDSTAEQWIAEKVSFTAAYGGERMAAWIFVPKHGKPPYQTVVFFPGSGVLNLRRSTTTPDPRISFYPPAGRVAVMPIYKSTFERGDSLRSDIADQSIFWRDHVVMWVKDYKRTLDYLGTRADIDTTKLAYMGFSWGGYMGAIIPAVEPRIKASVLYVAGLTMERSRAEVDPVYYLPRFKSPVLMLNGQHDFFFPTKTAQEPFFDLLGTAPPDKQYHVYEGGHDVPRTELIKQSLAWLDKYLGPVR